MWLGYICIVLVSIYLLIGLFLARKLNHWIDCGTDGSKPYTRLTMLMMVISFVGILIMATTLVINGALFEYTQNALISQINGIPPVDAEIYLNLNEPEIPISHISIGLDSSNETDFFPRKNSILLTIGNRGQSPTGNIRVEVSDPDNFFVFTPKNDILSLNPIEPKLYRANFYTKHCESRLYTDRRSAFDGCYSNMPIGFYKFNIKIECPLCKQTKKCYTFEKCIYNSSEEKDNCLLKYIPAKNGLNLIECNTI